MQLKEWTSVEKGKNFYRVSENRWVTIEGFFYMFGDDTRSVTVKDYRQLCEAVVKSGGEIDRIRVLFKDSTFDTIDRLDSNRYLTENTYNNTQEYTQDDYDGQHAEEKVLWYESDLVPNPGDKPKSLKLFK